MRKIENELDELVYEEYGEELDAKDKEIEDHKKIIKTKDGVCPLINFLAF